MQAGGLWPVDVEADVGSEFVGCCPAVVLLY